jgi:hypothetical protein
MSLCAVCGKSNVRVCQNCMNTRYCGRECQRRDWPSHKTRCVTSARLLPKKESNNAKFIQLEVAVIISRYCYHSSTGVAPWTCLEGGTMDSSTHLINCYQMVERNEHDIVKAMFVVRPIISNDNKEAIGLRLRPFPVNFDCVTAKITNPTNCGHVIVIRGSGDHHNQLGSAALIYRTNLFGRLTLDCSSYIENNHNSASHREEFQIYLDRQAEKERVSLPRIVGEPLAQRSTDMRQLPLLMIKCSCGSTHRRVTTNDDFILRCSLC